MPGTICILKLFLPKLREVLEFFSPEAIRYQNRLFRKRLLFYLFNSYVQKVKLMVGVFGSSALGVFEEATAFLLFG